MAPTKYEQCKRRKVDTVMKEFKKGNLKGPGGTKIKNNKQAIAIGLSEANRKCDPKDKESANKIHANTNAILDGNRKLSRSMVGNIIDLIETTKNTRMRNKLLAKLNTAVLEHLLDELGAKGNQAGIIDDTIKINRKMF